MKLYSRRTVFCMKIEKERRWFLSFSDSDKVEVLVEVALVKKVENLLLICVLLVAETRVVVVSTSLVCFIFMLYCFQFLSVVV